MKGECDHRQSGKLNDKLTARTGIGSLDWTGENKGTRVKVKVGKWILIQEAADRWQKCFRGFL